MPLLWNLRETLVNKKFLLTVGMAVVLVLVGIVLYLRYKIPNVRKEYENADCISPRNPSRGFYVQINSNEPGRVEKYADRVSLFLMAYDIYEYRDRELPEEKLEELDVFFEALKQAHAKAIFRAAYGFDRYEENDAASREILERHIEQIAPILNRHREQVYCVQAGWYGPWGEWHSSRYTNHALKTEGVENRVWLVKTLLSALNEEIPLGLRRPSFIQEAVEAGCDVTRLGFYDDGLLGSETELGTFDEGKRDETFEWVQKNLKAPMGGEMPKTNEYAEVLNADQDFDLLNISYLNLKYNENILDSWKETEADFNGNGTENAFDYIADRLGYRFRLEQLVYPKRVNKDFFGRRQRVELTIHNDGYAAIAAGYRFEWVLETFDGNEVRVPDEAGRGEKAPYLALDEVGTDAVYIAQLDPQLLRDNVRSVGFRIYREGDPLTDKECVQVVNAGIRYEDGVHELLVINGEGVVEAR